MSFSRGKLREQYNAIIWASMFSCFSQVFTSSHLEGRTFLHTGKIMVVLDDNGSGSMRVHSQRGQLFLLWSVSCLMKQNFCL